jgi:hypothetical protein
MADPLQFVFVLGGLVMSVAVRGVVESEVALNGDAYRKRPVKLLRVYFHFF